MKKILFFFFLICFSFFLFVFLFFDLFFFFLICFSFACVVMLIRFRTKTKGRVAESKVVFDAVHRRSPTVSAVADDGFPNVVCE